MYGIGLTMEAIEQNPVLYELMMDNTWRNEPVNVNAWLNKYIHNRYGLLSNNMVDAWQILKTTVYNGKLIRDGAESILTGRPTLDSSTVWTRTTLNYSPKELLPAWDLFIQSADSLKESDGFRYDLVDVTRQVLANYALPLQQKWVKAFREGDTTAFNTYSNRFLQLASDMDTLLGTRRDFLLGPWIANARAWGTTKTEKETYERNARDLVTLWGNAESPLHEYANRQWSGLMNDFYQQRWAKFFNMLRTCLQQNTKPGFEGFERNIKQWEWAWVNKRKDYPLQPRGDAIVVAKKLYRKYYSQINDAY